MENNYIAMCREAVEIQERWMPKGGDFYLYRPRKHLAFSPNKRIVLFRDTMHAGTGCTLWLPQIEDLVGMLDLETMAKYVKWTMISTSVDWNKESAKQR